jgi:hypothetical protein
MTITLEIKPETKERLARQAAEHGLDVAAYTVNLLEKAARAAPSERAPSGPRNMVELFAPVRGFNIDFERDRDTGRDIEF